MALPSDKQIGKSFATELQKVSDEHGSVASASIIKRVNTALKAEMPKEKFEQSLDRIGEMGLLSGKEVASLKELIPSSGTLSKDFVDAFQGEISLAKKETVKCIMDKSTSTSSTEEKKESESSSSVSAKKEVKAPPKNLIIDAKPCGIIPFEMGKPCILRNVDGVQKELDFDKKLITETHKNLRLSHIINGHESGMDVGELKSKADSDYENNVANEKRDLMKTEKDKPEIYYETKAREIVDKLTIGSFSWASPQHLFSASEHAWNIVKSLPKETFQKGKAIVINFPVDGGCGQGVVRNSPLEKDKPPYEVVQPQFARAVFSFDAKGLHLTTLYGITSEDKFPPIAKKPLK